MFSILKALWKRLVKERNYVALAVTLVFSYLIIQLFRPTIQVTPEGTLAIKAGILSQRNIYTLLVDPHGWQDTGVALSPGDKLYIHTSGKITTGLDVTTIGDNAEKAYKYTQEVREKIKTENLKEADAITKVNETNSQNYRSYPKDNQTGFNSDYLYGWPWVGADGYPDDTPHRYGKIPSLFTLDTSLISNKYPAGRLIGYAKDGKCPELENNKGKENNEADFIMNFASDEVTVPADVKKGAKLCLAINDSINREWQYDNAGFLMVTIEKY